MREQGQRALRAAVRHRLVAEDDVSSPALDGVSHRIARVRTLEVQRPANALRRRDHQLSISRASRRRRGRGAPRRWPVGGQLGANRETAGDPSHRRRAGRRHPAGDGVARGG